MFIYLIRHGETHFNSGGQYKSDLDMELNDRGVRQAKLLGERLRKYKIDCIYSSDFERAKQTSAILKNSLNIEIRIRSELREIFAGEWEGMSIEDIKIKYVDFLKEWWKHQTDMHYPGGECGEDVKNRVLPVIEEIGNEQYENIAIVTHAGVIRTLLSVFLGLSLEKRFNIDVDNCGISIINYNPSKRKSKIKCINDASHLEGNE